MKKENKIPISSVLNLLAERDPDWKLARMAPKLKVLYDSWRQKELRYHHRSHYFLTESWKRGWLPIEDWNRWRDYACSREKPQKAL